MGNPTLVASIKATGRPSWSDGQDEGVGARQQLQHVVALAEELEPLSQPQIEVTGVESGTQRPAPHRGETDGEPDVRDGPGRGEQHVVALLGTEVGHGHEQQLFVAHAELGPHAVPELRPPGDQGVRPGQIDAVYHGRGPPLQWCRKGVVGRLRHRHEPFPSVHRDTQQRSIREPRTVPQAVLGVDDAGPGRAGQGSHDQLPQCGCVREVEVDHVEVPAHQQPAKGRQPPHIRVAGRRRGRAHGVPPATTAGTRASWSRST